MKIFKYTLFTCCSIFFIECATPPEYPVEPRIEFLSFTKDTLQGGFDNEDFLFVRFSFTDGDGDFGFPSGQNERNVFIVDSRSNDTLSGFTTPEIPDLGASDDISGEVKIQIFNSCCIYPDYTCGMGLIPGQPPFDSLTYTIFVTDRAGNISNEIITPSVFLECN